MRGTVDLQVSGLAVIRQSDCAIDLTRPIQKLLPRLKAGGIIIQSLGPNLQRGCSPVDAPFVKSLAALLLLWGFSVLNAQQDQNTRFDFSCSTFPANLSESDLLSRYGQGNVITAMITGADDPSFEGTVLFPNQDDARVEIAWYDAKTKQSPAWVRIRGQHSRWRLPNGIALGDDLLGVERRNGFPFRLSSFSVEGQGTVRSWGRGRIQNADTERCGIKISFQPNWDGTDDPMFLRQVIRGLEFSSGHPAMQAINPRVRAISITYPVK